MDDKEFENSVKQYLQPYEGYFHYQNMLKGHLDNSRFYDWVREVDQYHRVAGAVVLSSGCGSAGDLLAFIENGASYAYGIEVDFSLGGLARKRFMSTPYHRRVNISIYDGQILPYPRDTFDIIFSMHVIEHTSDPRLYIKELFRVLKPRGVIFLDVPNRYYPIEQHTMLRYIHFPPVRIRNRIIKIILRHPRLFGVSNEKSYKLGTLINFQLPTAADLIEIYKAEKDREKLKIIDAFFHSYDGDRVNFTSHPGKYLIGRPRYKTTFRLVIHKSL